MKPLKTVTGQKKKGKGYEKLDMCIAPPKHKHHANKISVRSFLQVTCCDHLPKISLKFREPYNSPFTHWPSWVSTSALYTTVWFTVLVVFGFNCILAHIPGEPHYQHRK